jgi:cytokinin trans-hydroxylase
MGNLMKEIIQERRDSVRVGRMESYGNDLLGLMLAASEEAQEAKAEAEEAEAEAEEGKQLSDLGIEEPKSDAGRRRLNMEQIMDECKTFFFAGHETSAGLLTWSLLLLASNPEWQDKARAEVVEVLGGQGKAELPDASALHKLKIVSFLFCCFFFLDRLV